MGTEFGDGWGFLGRFCDPPQCGKKTINITYRNNACAKDA